MEKQIPTPTPIKELRLGDVVQVWDGPWGTATIHQIADDCVFFERPYGARADFSFTGGVLCYVGIERFHYRIDSDSTIGVWSRADLK
jgi:hypothetical protein